MVLHLTTGPGDKHADPFHFIFINFSSSYLRTFATYTGTTYAASEPSSPERRKEQSTKKENGEGENKARVRDGVR